jgi:predicted O-methyltransferase YrrM
MNALKYLVDKYDLDLEQKSPIEIPNVDRQTLTQWFSDLKLKTGVEVGVERGVYSEVIARNNPQMKLYLVDPWEAYKGYREHVSQSKLDGFYELTKEKMSKYKKVELIRKYSSDASKDFKDNSLDMVYIDANHEFRHVVNDIADWYPKVKKGGILSGHDYIRRKNAEYLMGVIDAVHGYTSAYKIKPYFVLGRKEVRDGELRDNTRSWMLVKS